MASTCATFLKLIQEKKNSKTEKKINKLEICTAPFSAWESGCVYEINVFPFLMY